MSSRPASIDGADDVERLVAVERRDLDGDDGRDLGEAAPEGVRQRPAADRGLQVEADERDAGADRRAVRDERGIVRVGQRGEAEQPGVVAEAHQQIRFATGLSRVVRRRRRSGSAVRRAARPRDPFPRARAPAPARTGRRGIADRELRRVHADREAAGAGGGVVAGQRPLAALVEAAVLVSAPADARE